MATVNPNQLLAQELQARFEQAYQSQIGFFERMVWFWSNHFCVSAQKSVMRPLVGPFEREAIRPHVLGTFTDMLLAVERHPAMLIYLDNVRSIGPNSPAAKKEGRRESRGLNENLAREILELHTLGVRSVYSQTDVTNLAKVITGWTVRERRADSGGDFIFESARHEPGQQILLGKSYPDSGVEQGIAALKDIAANPATSTHIATKLVRHFIADEPPPALVDRIARRFRETGGSLKAIAVELVTAPEGLDAPRTKLKRPAEWMMSIWRAIGKKPDMKWGNTRLAALGEAPWKPGSPKGFSDDSATWGGSLGARLDLVNDYAMGLEGTLDGRQILQSVLGPLASKETVRTIAAADSPSQALTLLFMCPEFLRR